MQSPRRDRLWRDGILLALGLLAVGQAAWVGVSLRVPDLSLHYGGGPGWMLAAWPDPSFAAHPWVDVARLARNPHSFETLDPDLFSDAESIVYLERSSGADESRWRPVYRLGNAPAVPR